MRKNTQSGLTLIETLIYIVLFGILISGSVTSAWQIAEAGKRNKDAFALEEEENFIVRKINWELQGAKTIVVTHSPKEKITIEKTGSQNVEIEATGGTITVSKGDGIPKELSGSMFKIADVHFSEVVDSNILKPNAFIAELTINGKKFVYKTYVKK